MTQGDYKEAIETINEIRMYDKDMWGVFFLGTQLAIGKTRIYANKGTATKRIVDILDSGPQVSAYMNQPYMYSRPGDVGYARNKDKYDQDMIKYTAWEKKYKESVKKSRDKAKEIVVKLEESGMLEFRQLGDRTPKFPRNKVGIDKEQAERFEKMLDASDEEMVNLAITALNGL